MGLPLSVVTVTSWLFFVCGILGFSISMLLTNKPEFPGCSADTGE